MVPPTGMHSLSTAANGPYAARMPQAPLDAADDAALARRILAAGPATDAAAEAELCRRFAPRIRLYGLKHLRGEAAAADLVQDVLLTTLEKLRAGEVREPARIASFIFGTCQQTMIDGRRTGRRRERILGAYPLDLLPDTAGDLGEPPPDGLLRCLERLPERERAVLVLTFYDDRPADEVGRELGLSAGNVRVIRHRGIERLRLCLNVAEGEA
jgi:RNA polymerase sigma-70 factor (ECF subfamily)